MDFAKLKALIRLVAQSNISELEITEGADFVRIRKALAPSTPTPRNSRVETLPAGDGITAPRSAPSVDSPSDGSRDHAVTAPMCGIFLRTPSPGAAPFVEIGQYIEPGQKLCIIEAMKWFNAVNSETAGTLTAILAEHGQEVEAGQPLFNIRPPGQQS